MSLLASKFRQANFRGVEFKVDGVDTEVGRRVVTHEYPQRDSVNTEDLGLRKREFSIEGYVLGTSYELRRDNLIKACEKSGSGLLVHPYLGTKSVVCTGCRVREGRGELGIAYFSLTFVEVGVEEFPKSTIDRATSLGLSATGALSSASTAFEKGFSLATAPSFVLDSATAKVNQFADTMDAQRAKVRSTTEALANFTYKVRNLKAQVNDIVKTPGQLAAMMQDAIQGLVDLVPTGSKDVKDALAGLLSFYVGFPIIPLTTANRVLEQANQDALINLVKRTVEAQQCILAASLAYDSFDDADIQRTERTDAVDDIMENSEDDDVFLAFQKVRAQLVRAVPPADQDLPTLVSFTPEATIASIVLVYDLYESADKEEGLIARNKIRNPAFVRGGVPLEVEGAA